MTRVLSLHEYDLRSGVEPSTFEAGLRRAEARGLFHLPGLRDHLFLRGLKGARRGGYAALWIYESREAWEGLWGPPESPLPRSRHPARWRVWEEEILAPFLTVDPHQVRFTAYEELFG